MVKNNYQSRHTCPEVSYTCICATVNGMMGVEANAPENFIETVPRLPEEISWIDAENIILGDHLIKVRHDENR